MKNKLAIWILGVFLSGVFSFSPANSFAQDEFSAVVYPGPKKVFQLACIKNGKKTQYFELVGGGNADYLLFMEIKSIEFVKNYGQKKADVIVTYDNERKKEFTVKWTRLIGRTHMGEWYSSTDRVDKIMFKD